MPWYLESNAAPAAAIAEVEAQGKAQAPFLSPPEKAELDATLGTIRAALAGPVDPALPMAFVQCWGSRIQDVFYRHGVRVVVARVKG